jgi:hypothetical protein
MSKFLRSELGVLYCWGGSSAVSFPMAEATFLECSQHAEHGSGKFLSLAGAVASFLTCRRRRPWSCACPMASSSSQTCSHHFGQRARVEWSYRNVLFTFPGVCIDRGVQDIAAASRASKRRHGTPRALRTLGTS